MTGTTLLTDLFIIGLFVIAVYAFSVLPRQREFRARQKLVSQLKPGVEVITYGGMIGKVKQVDPASGVVILEIANGIEIRVLAQAISAEFDPKAIAESAQRVAK